MADKKLRIPRKLKTETHKQLKIRTDMNSDAPYESAVRTSLIPLAHYFRYTSFMKNVQKMYSLFVWYIFKTGQQFTMVSKHTLVQISLYSWLNGQYMLPYKMYTESNEHHLN
jgi:hypothetical protein